MINEDKPIRGNFLESANEPAGSISSEFNIDTDGLNTPERRRKSRPSRKDASGQLYYQLQIDKITKRMFGTAPGLILITIFFAINVSAIYWALNVRLPQIHSNLMLLQKKVVLDNRLFELNSQWSKNDLKNIEDSIRQAESKIFASFPLLASWLSEKKSYATALGFEMNYTIGSAENVNIVNTYSLPVEIKLTKNSNVNNAYSKVLIFSRSIIDENRRLEVASVDVVASDSGIQRYDLVLNLWVKDPNKIIQNSTSIGIEKNGGTPDEVFIQ